MAKTRNILKRVRAVGNIRTVTRAMQMVATARFKVVHDRVTAFSPFSTHLQQMVADLVVRAAAGEEISHPLLVPQTGTRRDVLLVITSNRGLCGSYNSSVLKLAMSRLAQLRGADYDVLLHAVGARGARYLRFRKIDVDREYLELLGESLRDQIAALEQEIHELAGEPFNINSTLQLRKVLYDDLQLPVLKKTSKGAPSTDASVLAKLEDAHPIVERLLRYRWNQLMFVVGQVTSIQVMVKSPLER